MTDSWAVFTEHLRLCLSLFAVFHLVAAALSFLLLLAASSLGDAAAIPARLTAGVVLPVIAGSLAVAALSRHVLAGRPPGETGSDPAAPRGLARSDVIGMTLIAALVAVGAVIFLGGFGILLLPFFYGPPIAMQFVVTGEMSLSEALHSARAAVAGSWHTMLYLLLVALILGVISIVPVGGLVSLANGRADLYTIAALSLGRGLLIGLFAGFLGAMQIAIFQRLRRPETAARGGTASPD